MVSPSEESGGGFHQVCLGLNHNNKLPPGENGSIIRAVKEGGDAAVSAVCGHLSGLFMLKDVMYPKREGMFPGLNVQRVDWAGECWCRVIREAQRNWEVGFVSSCRPTCSAGASD